MDLDRQDLRATPRQDLEVRYEPGHDEIADQARQALLQIERISDAAYVASRVLHAHERVLYERIRDRIASGRVLSQRLLLRALFEATPEEAETIESRFEDLSAAGFEIEPLSGRSYSIAAIPAEATDREPPVTLRGVLEMLMALKRIRSGAATGWRRSSPAAPPSRFDTTSPRRSSGAS